MRAKFEDTMTTSNQLIRDEARAVNVARRLQEQNDQLLDLLLDMNESGRLPSSLRLDLREAPEIEADPAATQPKLHQLREDMVNGVITPEEFARRSEALHNAPPVNTERSLVSLEARVPHTSRIPEIVPEGIMLGEHAPGYMSPSHEDDYLLHTDLALIDPSYDPSAHDGRPLRIPPARPVPTDKDLHIQNPDSVYNWLRKHQPQVFLQDKDAHGGGGAGTGAENMSEKSGPGPAKTTGRKSRPSAAAKGEGTPGPKVKGEDDDEDVPETGGKGRRGKKDGEDDSAYRPKGGSSRPAKRKRGDTDGDTPAKGRGKKGRTSAGAAAT